MCLTMIKIFPFLLLLFFGIGVFNEANAQCCDYKLIMQDSYGDGWNGGQLQVLVNNLSVGTFAASGYSSIANITVCTGDAISLIYSSGDWEEENTFVLQDASFNMVFQNGPNPTVGNSFNGVVDCDTPPLLGSHPCLAFTMDTYDCYAVNNANFPGSGITPNCANYQGSDIWHKVAIPPSGNLSIETLAGSVDDTGIRAWIGNDCGSLTPVGCDDDGGAGYLSFLLLYDLIPEDTLYIQSWKWGGGGGTYQICVTEIPDVNLESSNLPIVVINTLGQTINQDEKINCSMEIKYNGPNNLTFLNGPSNVYNGTIGIEIRGASSSGYPQKPYGFETRTSAGANLNVSILGMPQENDWVLISNYNDRSMLKNLLAYKIFREMGHYSPRGELCEVIINDSYQGIYLIGEKIKRDNNRVNINSLNTNEISGDDLTGGYILQQNYWNNDNSFQSNFSPIDHPNLDVHFIYEYPKPQDIVPQQKAYIASFVNSLETALYSPNFMDPVNGYRKYLDVPSFIDYFIVNEVSRNNDGFKKSVFYHKNKNSLGGKLKAGPVWDFDWAWKNIAECFIVTNNGGSGWAHQVNDCNPDNNSTGWYIRMLQDSTFANALRCRYEALRQTSLDTVQIFAYIDSMGVRLSEPQARHFQKWPILGVSGPAPDDGPVATSHLEELQSMKNWIWTRLQWLDANMPGNAQNCNQSGVGLNDLALSPLRCYPNPTSDQLYIEVQWPTNAEATLKLFNTLGAEILIKKLDISNAQPQPHTIDLRNTPPGVYTMRLELADQVFMQRILVSR